MLPSNSYKTLLKRLSVESNVLKIYILSNKRNCALLKVKSLWNQQWYLHEIFWKFISTPVAMGLNQFHVSFRKWSRSQHTLCDFKFSTATLTKHDNQTAFVWRWFPFTLKQQQNMFCSQLALSVTCTNTPRLSADDCLQDAGMLQPGISYSRAAAHFGFHRDIVQKLQKHYHVSFTACDCLRSHHQHVMSKGRGVYIRGKHVHNRSQTACAISRKILGYVQSVPKLVTTICAEHAICHCRPCV